jgi:hypothetical protein
MADVEADQEDGGLQSRRPGSACCKLLTSFTVLHYKHGHA